MILVRAEVGRNIRNVVGRNHQDININYIPTLNNRDLYFVAVKVFLRDAEGKLFIFKDRFGDWDLPGGRLRGDDFDTPWEEIIIRKMKKELGEKIEYKLGAPVVFMRHERSEWFSDGVKEQVRIFSIGYEAEYLSGEIDLGENHLEYEFVSLENFRPEEYFIGGWLEGVKEYIKKTMKK